MRQKENLKWSPDVLFYPLFLVMSLWIVFWIEHRFRFNLNFLGIYPRTIPGLKGLLFGPFIHGSLKHLFNNSVALLVLLASLFFFYRNLRWQVLIYGMLFTGLLTWVIGRPSLHIGASGVVYMLVSFIFFKGILSRHYQLTALALIVVFLYGGLWWYVFPIDPGISWEGHLSGFIVGLAISLVTRHEVLPQRKYEWELESFDESKDPFISHFDKDGNFIEASKPIVLTPEDTSMSEQVEVVYDYKEEKKQD